MKTRRYNSVLVLLLGILTATLGEAYAEGGKEKNELSVNVYREFSDMNTRERRWALILTFNYAVFPANLTTSMKITVDGKEQGFELCLPGSNERAVTAAKQFRIVSTEVIDKSATAVLTIEKGLSDATGRFLLTKEFSYQFLTATEIRIIDWQTFYKSRQDKGLILNASEYVHTEDLKKALKFTPELQNISVTREQASRFIIRGDFQHDADYLLTVSSQLVNDSSGFLVGRKIRFKGPGITTDIAFNAKGSLVELIGRQIIPLTLSNVKKIRCTLTKIPPYYIPDHTETMQDDSDKSADGAKLLDASRYKESLASLAKIQGPVVPFLGDFVEDAEVFFVPDSGPEVSGYSLPLRFRKKPEEGGAWFASFTDLDGKARTNPRKFLQITDLSISYKISSRSLLLWVTSLHTGKPVSGIPVMVVSENNTRYFVGQTNEKGVLLLKNGEQFPSVERGKEGAGLSKRPLETAKLTVAVASRGTDACAVKLNAFRLKPVGITQASDFSEPTEARRGYLFTERGVYRPGETVHFKLYGRLYKNKAIVSPTGETVNIEITGPTGDVVYAKNLKLNDFGSTADSLKIERFFPTGTYTIKASFKLGRNEGEKVVHTFLVQEYKRPKHFVTLEFSRTEKDANDLVLVQKKEEFLVAHVASQYYTGGPVKHAKVRWKASLVPIVNAVSGYESFFFGNADETTQFLESGESVLDKEGRIQISIPLDSRLFTGINGIKFSATVVDIDGEPATEVGTYEPRPLFLVGISPHPREVQQGFSSPIKIIVIDREGKKIPEGAIEAQIMRKEYFPCYKRDDARNINYVVEEGWLKQSSSKINISKGEALFQLDLAESGHYLISFSYADSTGKYMSQTTIKVGWQDYYRSDVQRSEERFQTPVMLALTKKEIRTGETVGVSFHTPRPVRCALVTIEKDQVLDYLLVEVNGRDGSFELIAAEGFQPNVYLSVMAPAPREGYPVYSFQVDTELPAVYYGFTNLSVRSSIQKLKIQIQPDIQELKGRPGETQSLGFQVTDSKGTGVLSELAVCVVDEAVLALTRFKTPDLTPLTQFVMALGVFSGDLRMDLVSQDLYRIFSTKPLTGGDLGFGEVAGSLKLRKDFRPVAYFNPSLITDEAGRARVEFRLPDTTTAYRVYVVACDKETGFASTEKKMVVTKEFFMEPSPPRFLIPGDKVRIPVTLHNKTGEKGKVALEAESSPDLRLSLPVASVELQPFGSGSIFVEVQSLGGVDESVMRLKGICHEPSGSFGDAVEQTIAIHSRYLPVRRTLVGSVSGKARIPVALPQALRELKPEQLSNSDLKAYLSLSTNLWPKIAPGLKYLLTYPFGCIEQTSSAIIPLIGIRGLTKVGAIPDIKETDVDEYLKAGIERLLSMQMPNGGFTYWPGEKDESWWGTMYATFALQMASEAGYEVPTSRLKAALGFLREGLFSEQEDRYQGQEWTREFAVYCLALGNALQPSELEVFLEKWGTLTAQNKALLLLAAQKTNALSNAEIRKWLTKVKPRLDVSRKAYYDSTYRELAVCLLAALDSGVKLREADAWAAHLISGMKPEGRWFSTADTGWALLALSRYFKDKDFRNEKVVTIRLRYGTETGDPTQVSLGNAAEHVELDIAKLMEQGAIILETEPKTLVHYTLSLTYPDLISDPTKLSRGFSLHKTIERFD